MFTATKATPAHAKQVAPKTLAKQVLEERFHAHSASIYLTECDPSSLPRIDDHTIVQCHQRGGDGLGRSEAACLIKCAEPYTTQPQFFGELRCGVLWQWRLLGGAAIQRCQPATAHAPSDPTIVRADDTLCGPLWHLRSPHAAVVCRRYEDGTVVCTSTCAAGYFGHRVTYHCAGAAPHWRVQHGSHDAVNDEQGWQRDVLPFLCLPISGVNNDGDRSSSEGGGVRPTKGELLAHGCVGHALPSLIRKVGREVRLTCGVTENEDAIACRVACRHKPWKQRFVVCLPRPGDVDGDSSSNREVGAGKDTEGMVRSEPLFAGSKWDKSRDGVHGQGRDTLGDSSSSSSSSNSDNGNGGSSSSSSSNSGNGGSRSVEAPSVPQTHWLLPSKKLNCEAEGCPRDDFSGIGAQLSVRVGFELDVACDGSGDGSTCQLQCAEGLRGLPTHLTCEGNRWIKTLSISDRKCVSHTPASCSQVSLPSPQDGYLWEHAHNGVKESKQHKQGEVSHGSEVLLSCAEGFQAPTSAHASTRVRCFHGQWVYDISHPPSCARVLTGIGPVAARTCGDPPLNPASKQWGEVDVSKATCSGSTPGHMCSYTATCGGGDRHALSFVCQMDGTWRRIWKADEIAADPAVTKQAPTRTAEVQAGGRENAAAEGAALKGGCLHAINQRVERFDAVSCGPTLHLLVLFLPPFACGAGRGDVEVLCATAHLGQVPVCHATCRGHGSQHAHVTAEELGALTTAVVCDEGTWVPQLQSFNCSRTSCGPPPKPGPNAVVDCPSTIGVGTACTERCHSRYFGPTVPHTCAATGTWRSPFSKHDCESRAELDAYIRNHTLLFITGAHHSGTSLAYLLLSTHPQASTLTNTGAKEDEGQHLQRVYKKANMLGGESKFALHPEAHLNATHSATTPDMGLRLLQDWKRFWNGSRQLLVEKSPRHTTMMPFLQALFPRSRFLVMLRHPLGCTRRHWAPEHLRRIREACAAKLIENWAAAYESAVRASSQLVEVVFVQYELLMHFETREQWQDILSFLGIDTTHAGALSIQPAHGGRDEGTRSNDNNDDADDDDDDTASPPCDDTYAKFEDRVRAFGYSLRRPSTLHRPHPDILNHLLPRQRQFWSGREAVVVAGDGGTRGGEGEDDGEA